MNAWLRLWLDHAAVGHAFVPAGFVPEREFDPIPESKFVKDDAKVVFHDILSRADDVGYFSILESLGDELDDLPLAWAGDAGSVEAASGHRLARFWGLHSELLIQPRAATRVPGMNIPEGAK